MLWHGFVEPMFSKVGSGCFQGHAFGKCSRKLYIIVKRSKLVCNRIILNRPSQEVTLGIGRNYQWKFVLCLNRIYAGRFANQLFSCFLLRSVSVFEESHSICSFVYPHFAVFILGGNCMLKGERL